MAADLAEDTWLLCFDEFHVVNIADAMIFRASFEALFAAGRGGDRHLQLAARSGSTKAGCSATEFEPFIALLKERLDILLLDSGTDYRLARLKNMPVLPRAAGPRATSRPWIDGFRAAHRGRGRARGRGRRLQGPGDPGLRGGPRGRALHLFGTLRASPWGREITCRSPSATTPWSWRTCRSSTAERRNEARRFHGP